MTGAPGRPLSSELSEQLLTVAVDILADEGWGRLNSDRIAARARAGKAGIYRRWPTMAALARAAVSRFRLVVVPEDGGSLRADLLGLLERWTRPLDREERAVASLAGAACHDEELRAGLDEALVRPLAAAVHELFARAEARGEGIDPERERLLATVLEAFWWQRYRLAEPLTAENVVFVVDEVLAPLLRGVGEPVAA
ncbi:TetR-like C-terminal domain-containing protein [Blastococcus sp. LR1]|uniref:TetR-like C-terminal domain-containing protein n=1 Tax=Blastococcus sp. LR1 TaxID=2877000 RepID=UPI001CCDC462|nr:TetR-like C-terminal domain-containing protein [Blastococcus sp. LR1]MCA0144914.1 TetR/AcrR family transcriptional regulator C-terminal ligand-binding domain-containing protein [Blastococcus sp. LR1]